ncbi:hypothetical protein G7K71_00500 [Desulfofundulus sp. TPOSR]|uniref:Uncharacterized protein n=1 Tax=Desulfofundulus kuznetsovii (strain DSM 6115 / VKM B-1805 / 17) TaxID=760568 RepID=A0AAU8PYD4_DESK7|nr:hypothetical protein [Desulfofundulus sp. TPOSR]AEG15038.1 hypothetical protein Desku_1455 [Desulfofundulus kuznetsovii DSM 6115]NHM25517.1 hypothetical protein [Desulfofundulus sp. TPOSR]
MSREFAAVIGKQFRLNEQEVALLGKNIRQLSRLERRTYFEQLKPREREFKLFLKEKYALLDEGGRQKWMDTTVQSLLEKGGDPDLADSLVMDVIGRLQVYKSLRERAENEGIRLKALTNFGGLSMVLFLVVIITAIVLYLAGR